MTTYTNINKPTGTSYSNLNPRGKEQYNQADLTYNDSGTYYNGNNPSQYTNVTKPSGTSYTNIAKPT